MLPFEGGTTVPVGKLVQQIEAAADEDHIEGITLLGGEPVAHAEGASVLAREVQHRGLTVMVFSGYLREEIERMPEPAVQELLTHTDLLVDGPYQRELPEQQRRWIGSTNQRIHFLTGRYREDDACWQMSNTLEIRMNDGEVSVNGFPARSAAGIWKRPRASS